jgi:UDP-sugar diphosphatase
MNVVLGSSLTPLDGRSTTVRTQESNLCNLLCDVFRRACSADVCIMNSGTFRCVRVLVYFQGSD